MTFPGGDGADGAAALGAAALGAVAALEVVTRAVDVLLAADFTAPATSDVLGLVRAIETQARRLHAASVAVVGQLTDRGLAAPAGASSTAALLRQLLPLSASDAYRRVRLAGATCRSTGVSGVVIEPALPLLAAALRSGAVGAVNAGVIVSTLNGFPTGVPMEVRVSVEEFLVEQAGVLDPRTFFHVARRIALMADPDGPFDERDATERQEFHIGRRRDDGLTRCWGLFDDLTMEALRAAFGAMCAPAADRTRAFHPDTSNTSSTDAGPPDADTRGAGTRGAGTPDGGGVGAGTPDGDGVGAATPDGDGAGAGTPGGGVGAGGAPELEAASRAAAGSGGGTEADPDQPDAANLAAAGSVDGPGTDSHQGDADAAVRAADAEATDAGAADTGSPDSGATDPATDFDAPGAPASVLDSGIDLPPEDRVAAEEQHPADVGTPAPAKDRTAAPAGPSACRADTDRDTGPPAPGADHPHLQTPHLQTPWQPTPWQPAPWQPTRPPQKWAPLGTLPGDYPSTSPASPSHPRDQADPADPPRPHDDQGPPPGPPPSPRPGPPAPADRRSAATRRAHAVGTIVTVFLGTGTAPTIHGEKPHLLVTVAESDLRDRVGSAQLGYGDTIPIATARMLACDAAVIPAVLRGPSEVIDVGRAMRTFTAACRKAILLRDVGCVFPGCTMPGAWCDNHHIEPWANGGPSNLDNAALLCRRHHTLVHRDLWRIRLGVDRTPEIIPPTSHDPDQRPQRNTVHRPPTFTWPAVPGWTT